MDNIIAKLVFSRKKPKVIVVTGKGCYEASNAIYFVLQNFFKVKNLSRGLLKPKDILENEILIFNCQKMINTKKLKFIIKNSSLPILVVGAQQFEKGIEILANVLPSFGCLISNFDQKQESQLIKHSIAFKLTYGFDVGAKMRAIDFHPSNNGAAFKLDFKGNVLPIWIPQPFGKKPIYSALTILSVCQVFNLNLVEVSQKLRTWQAMP